MQFSCKEYGSVSLLFYPFPWQKKNIYIYIYFRVEKLASESKHLLLRTFLKIFGSCYLKNKTVAGENYVHEVHKLNPHGEVPYASNKKCMESAE
jgi:hypothetical protein